MSPTSSTPRMNVYSSLDADKVIRYCESRLRAAFNVLEHADEHKAEWMYDNMIRELQISFTWIGLCAASGRLLDIPAVTRYLSRHLQANGSNAPPKDFGFLLSMDAGNHPSHSTGTARHYLADWWNKDTRPRPVDILHNDMLIKCLKYHEDQEQSKLGRIPASSGREYAGRQLVPADLDMPCQSCALYRAVAIDASHHLYSARNILQGNEAMADNQNLLITRRIAAFNGLFERAVCKETEDASTADAAPAEAPPAVKPAKRPRRMAVAKPLTVSKVLTNSQLAEVVRENAEAQYSRLQQHLEQNGSLKWTWGVDIEDHEIKHMFRAADRNFQLPHTGYDTSLRGPVPGESSVLPAHPTSSDLDIYSMTGIPDVSLLSDNGIPTHFNQFPLRRVRERVPSMDLPVFPTEYVPPGADIDASVVTFISGKDVQVCSLDTRPITDDVGAFEAFGAEDAFANQPILSGAAALQVLDDEASGAEDVFNTKVVFSGAGALQALVDECSGAEELEDEASGAEDAFNTKVVFPGAGALQALADESSGAEDPFDAPNLTGGTALQVLEDELFGAEDGFNTEPLLSGVAALRVLADELSDAEDAFVTQPIPSGAATFQMLEDESLNAADDFNTKSILSGAGALQALADESSGAEDPFDTPNLTGAAALQVLEDDSPGIEDTFNTKPLRSGVAALHLLEDDSSGAEADSEASGLEYIDAADGNLSFQQLANEDDPLIEQSLMIAVPLTAVEALQMLQEPDVGEQSTGRTLMPSKSGSWTAADFQHCVTPDDFPGDNESDYSEQ